MIDLNLIMQKFRSVNTLKNILGMLIGALGGYLYYFYIGCNSGSCPITSNPYMSVLWGTIIGYLVFDMFTLKPKTKEVE
jgi:hypothetical protein